MIALARHAEGMVLPVLAHPGAKHNAIMGERAGSLRVAVTSPPDKGKANTAIQSLLADFLGCKAANVTLLSGATSRRKRFLIAGIAEEELSRRLNDLLRELGQSKLSSGPILTDHEPVS